MIINFMTENLLNILLVIGAFAAFGVYYWQKKDEKKKAARVLIMEIRNAELEIGHLKKSGAVSDYSSILPTSSWTKYNHYFAKDLDEDELAHINNFYNSCQLVENEIGQLRSALSVAMEEKMKIIQEKLLELMDETTDKESYEKRKEKILKLFHKEDYWFLPNAPKEKLLRYLQNISFVMTSSAGQKLKKTADLK